MVKKTAQKPNLIVANWKMNFTEVETKKYLNELLLQTKNYKLKTNVVVAPPFTSLSVAAKTLKGSKIKVSAQNMYFEDRGAFMGEISATMVKEFAEYVIIGHSERRHILSERDGDIRRKVAKAVQHGLTPILCVGETQIQRDEGSSSAVVSAQIENGLADLSAKEIEKIIIAYEPVWALSTTAGHHDCTPQDAKKMIDKIRTWVSSLHGQKTGKEINVLYGGSVNGHNVAGYLKVPEINGALVGGASLHVDDFVKIIQISEKL